MNEELTDLIIKELGKHHSRDAIIMAVCEKGGLNWKQAEQLIEEVEWQHKRAIATRQSPVLLLISAVTIIAGLGLLAYGILFFADFFQRDVLERALLLRAGYYRIGGLLTGLAMLGGGSYGFWKTVLPLLENE
jgi:hypothetical protein